MTEMEQIKVVKGRRMSNAQTTQSEFYVRLCVRGSRQGGCSVVQFEALVKQSNSFRASVCVFSSLLETLCAALVFKCGNLWET